MPDNQLDSPEESGAASTQNKLTPQLVRQVTDKVYQLFLHDLKQENERRRIRNPYFRR